MKKAIFIFIILFSLKNTAQNTPQNELGAWYMYNGSHQISDKLSLKTMAHFRFFEIGDDLQQFIGRLGGNYKINKNMSATLGYSYLNTDGSFDVDGGEVNEHRIYEDFNIKHKINKLGFAHRFRAEQRFFNSTTSHFLRYQIGLSHPLNEKWSTYLYNEVFFDFDDEAYNQNWLGAGFKYHSSKKTTFKVGYQRINVNGDGNFNRILLGVAISTDHRKKK
ncbi:DUF2490 domain-containing protein [Tenacibaculum sp. HL-MS23]|uniref:DUF2490 domain-containing protein n=1 Tax=unclassified Tenacibaculum TaxID=2635139 RepID=UPI001C4ED43B|nr:MULTISPECIES: DUF2490 domain-containing protein [unclassified Tenacibaculum]QXP74391.1 DUF2490 domain-containing protein [Tenacibaculum sp. AHE14PA]QXP75240.1 DUF2490 domain-containing protein [Tenacibaculum sp. AHE15PA]WNW01778.1 DUF2490 domain-containing protein [Tenacibaculum sp. HL-MS23]